MADPFKRLFQVNITDVKATARYTELVHCYAYHKDLFSASSSITEYPARLCIMSNVKFLPRKTDGRPASDRATNMTDYIGPHVAHVNKKSPTIRANPKTIHICQTSRTCFFKTSSLRNCSLQKFWLLHATVDLKKVLIIQNDIKPFSLIITIIIPSLT